MSRDPIDGRNDYEFSREIEASVEAGFAYEGNSATFRVRNNKAVIMRATTEYLLSKQSTQNLFEKASFFHPAGTVELFDLNILSNKIDGYKIHIGGKYLIVSKDNAYIVQPDEGSRHLQVEKNTSKTIEDAREYVLKEAVHEFIRAVAKKRNIDMTQKWFNKRLKQNF